MSRPTLSHQRVTFVVVTALVLSVLAALVGPAQQANAAGYRYWGYWQLSGSTWGFAPKGPDQITPADGSVEGWRYAVGDETSTRMPRVTPTFQQVCANTPAETGKKRVGLVVDFGRDVDGAAGVTPPALLVKCAVVATTATGADVLATAGALRLDKALVCGIAGYPATGCADPVATMTDAQKAADTPLALPAPTAAPSAAPSAVASAATTAATTATAGSSISPVIWVALFLVAAAAAFVLARHRRPTGV